MRNYFIFLLLSLFLYVGCKDQPEQLKRSQFISPRTTTNERNQFKKKKQMVVMGVDCWRRRHLQFPKLFFVRNIHAKHRLLLAERQLELAMRQRLKMEE